MQGQTLEERVSRLEELVALSVGSTVDSAPAVDPADVEQSFNDLQVARWTRAVEDLMAKNGWTSEEASTNLANYLTSL